MPGDFDPAEVEATRRSRQKKILIAIFLKVAIIGLLYYYGVLLTIPHPIRDAGLYVYEQAQNAYGYIMNSHGDIVPATDVPNAQEQFAQDSGVVPLPEHENVF